MSSSNTSSPFSPNTPDHIYHIVIQCCGVTALLEQFAQDHGGNSEAAGRMLSGLGMLRERLEDLQERLDPCIGILATRSGAGHAHQ